jgi:GTP-binding protein EngB required for normal cell division
VEYLAVRELPTLVVLTKMDKLKRMERERSVDRAVRLLGIEPEQMLGFSSKTGKGRLELLAALDDLLGSGEEDA